MAAQYPGAAPSFTPVIDGVDYPQAVDINSLQDEIAAMGTALVSGGLAHDLDPDSTAGGRDLGSTSKQWDQIHAKTLNLSGTAELTIDSGAVTVTQSLHTLDTEADAASDDLDTITAAAGMGAGAILILGPEDVARVVTLKNGTGNLVLNEDFILSAANRRILLQYDGTNWNEIARSVQSAGTVLRCAAYHNTTQGSIGGSVTALNLNSEDVDSSTMHDTSTDNNRITIPVGGAGTYVVTGSTFASSGGNGTAWLHLRKNGTTIRRASFTTGGTNWEDQTLRITAILDLADGDYLDLAGEASGSTFTMGSATASDATRLSVVRIIG